MEINEEALKNLKDLNVRSLPLGDGRTVLEVFGRSEDTAQLVELIKEVRRYGE